MSEKEDEMDTIFITDIYVKKSRNVIDFNIPLSEEKRRHLIITGKNGSGKTSLLSDLNMLFDGITQGHTRIDGNIKPCDYSKPLISDNLTVSLYNQNLYPKIEIKNIFTSGSFIIAFFDAKRLSNMIVPAGIKKVSLKEKYLPAEAACKEFIQYIVNLKAERSFAKDDNDNVSAEKIDAWFDTFIQRLRKLFQSPELELEFDRKEYNFWLKENGKAPYTFNTLSDGYSALFMIISEIIMRMEGQNTSVYDKEGIVLVDEIETHLHVSLQKEILPLLADFFPNIQFIVTTHSPFVITSLENAVICDLEKRIVTQDLSAYSYDGIVEYYYGSDKYSTDAKIKFEEYKKLAEIDKRTQIETERLAELIQYFKQIPALGAPELMLSFLQFEQKRRDKALEAANGKN